jgi:hypothetical protein
VLVTHDGDRIGVGDRVATRRNDYGHGVANRDTWTVTGISDDGTIHLAGKAGARQVPLQYAVRHLDLAYASTVYGAQGDTTDTAHLVLGEHTGAASAYVAMTRGRDANTAHLVAENLDDARQQWALTFARDRADLGPAHAAQLAAEEAAKYLPYVKPRRPAQVARRKPVAGQQPGPDFHAPHRSGTDQGIGF